MLPMAMNDKGVTVGVAVRFGDNTHEEKSSRKEKQTPESKFGREVKMLMNLCIRSAFSSVSLFSHH